MFVYSCLSNFSAIRWTSPLPVTGVMVTGLQILASARRSGPLSREGSLSFHTYCDMGPRFILRFHPKDRHPRPTVGFEPPTQGSSDPWARRSNHCAKRAAWSHNMLKDYFLCKAFLGLPCRLYYLVVNKPIGLCGEQCGPWASCCIVLAWPT